VFYDQVVLFCFILFADFCEKKTNLLRVAVVETTRIPLSQLDDWNCLK